MKNCYIYVRSATTLQNGENNSCAYQAQLCKEYATQKGYRVIKVFTDNGVSGCTAEREGLSKLFNELLKNPNSVVLVSNIDRIARRFELISAIHNQIKKHNCQLETTQGDFDEPLMFMTGMLAGIEKYVRSERIKRGLRMKKELKERRSL